MSEKINVLIVEDKSLVADYIASILKANNMNVIATVPTGKQAIEISMSENPDLILMDIELEGPLDGIETAKIIEEKKTIPMIYLTDFSDAKTFTRAKETAPVNFLTKPFNEADLVRAIELAASNLAFRQSNRRQNLDAVFVRASNKTYIKVLLADVLFLRANRAYCEVVTRDKPYVLSNSLNIIAERISHPDFVRVHRSYVINVSKIDALVGYTATIGNEAIPIAKENLPLIKERLKPLK